MSDQEFKNYVALISKLLHLKQGQQESIGGELKDHLQTRVADLIEEGVPKETAFQQALEEFGDAAAMARNFQTVLDLKRRRWMMRFTTLAMAGVFLAAVFTMAMWPEGARFGTPATTMATTNDDPVTAESPPLATMQMSPATKSDLATEKALKQLTDLEYEETPFADVMRELEDKFGLNFMLDQSAKDDSLTAEELVTIRLKGVPLSKGLLLMLRAYNATYAIDEGVVQIISIDNQSDPEFLRLKMFDCRALSKALPKPAPEPLVLFRNGGGGFGGGGGGFGGGGGGGGVFCMSPLLQESTSDEKKKKNTVEEVALEKLAAVYEQWAAKLEKHVKSQRALTGEDTLLELVQSMVNPDSWRCNGSGEGQAKVVNGVLVVTQTEAGLRKIDQMLTDLRGQVLQRLEPVSAIERADNPLMKVAQQDQRQKATDVNDPFGGDQGTDSDPFGTVQKLTVIRLMNKHRR